MWLKYCQTCLIVVVVVWGGWTKVYATSVGHVIAVQGSRSIRTAGDAEFRTLDSDSPVALTDTVQTGSSGKVLIRLSHGGYASLGEFSEWYAYDFEQKEAARYFGADVARGAVRFIEHLPQTTPASAFTITTPTAMIGVEATGEQADFVVTVYSEKQTTVTVIRGRVRVKNLLEEIPDARIVESCQQVDVDAGKPPSKVILTSSKHLRELVAFTTIPGTLPEDVPNCRPRYSIPPDIFDYGELPVQGVDVFYTPSLLTPWCAIPTCGDWEVWNGDRCVPCEWVGMTRWGRRCVRTDCPRCTVWDGTRCVSCEEFGMECHHGRCRPPRCGPCTVWNGRRCVTCSELGLACVDGQCVPKDCGPCKELRGNRCVSCAELGLICRNGRCTRATCPSCSIWDGRRCVRCEEYGLVCVGGRCVSVDCAPCTVRRGNRCVSCSEVGMVCEGGRCVYRPCGPCQVRRGGNCVSCEDAGMVCRNGVCETVPGGVPLPGLKPGEPHPSIPAVLPHPPPAGNLTPAAWSASASPKAGRPSPAYTGGGSSAAETGRTAPSPWRSGVSADT